MKALAITRRPKPGHLADVIEMVDIAAPVPRGREVLVRVIASTINIDDIHVAEGTFYGGIPIGPRPRPGRPVTPGSDLAGVVAGVGDRARSFHVGDAVFGIQMPFHAGGAWAEFCVVDEQWLAQKPENLSFAEAAACGVSGLVASCGVRELRLRAGSHIVIVGATGGIGGMAVQLAVRAGAEVTGVCGTASVDKAYQLGCSRVIDYTTESWDLVIAHEDGRGGQGRQGNQIDGVLDLVGGRDVEAAASHVLGRDGRFVSVVGPERFIGDRALGWVGVLRVLGRVGYRMIRSMIRGPRYILTGPGLGSGKYLADVARDAAAGVIPPIDTKVPFKLESMREALRRAASHHNRGRIVIEMEG